MSDNGKYNYVICGSSAYYVYGYHDIIAKENVRYYSSLYEGIESKFKRFLVRLCYSKKVNKIIKHPFEDVIFPYLYKSCFNDEKALCYLLFGRCYELLQSSYVDYLRSRYKGVRIVLFLQDLVKSYNNINIDYLKRKFDLVISYDKIDAERYGLLYHPTPMSYVKVDDDLGINESDFYFCGYAKSRYPAIHSLYTRLTENGYKCDFNVFKLPDDVNKLSGINYIDSIMSYKQNLQHIQKTKCIVEVMQDGAVGFTPRLWESIMYDKHLLTNNKSVFESPFFNMVYHHILEDLDSLKDIKWVTSHVSFSSKDKQKLSPVHLLSFIEDSLSKNS